MLEELLEMRAWNGDTRSPQVPKPSAPLWLGRSGASPKASWQTSSTAARRNYTLDGRRAACLAGGGGEALAISSSSTERQAPTAANAARRLPDHPTAGM